MLLGDGQEAARRRAGPRSGCCQRTSASTATAAPVSSVDDRLVDEPQLVALERAAQALLDLQPVAQPAAHRAVEDLERAAAAGLDALERGVGALDEVGAVVVLDRDADRGGEVDAGHRALERAA